MKYIRLDYPLPDGRIMKFHKVLNYSILPSMTEIEILIGSYEISEDQIFNTVADATFKLILEIQPEELETLHTNITERVFALSPWNQGQLVDLNQIIQQVRAMASAATASPVVLKTHEDILKVSYGTIVRNVDPEDPSVPVHVVRRM